MLLIIVAKASKSAEEETLRLIRRATMQARKIKGRKRHILVDTQGRLMHAVVHAADVQDPRRRRAADGETCSAAFRS